MKYHAPGTMGETQAHNICLCLKEEEESDSQYEDNQWLGVGREGGEHTSAEGEWPVSYHGTGLHAGMDIAAHGFDLSKSKLGVYGNGVYSTPDIEVAALYAKSFTSKGKTYKVVVQNRVNPANLKTVDGSGASRDALFDFFVTQECLIVSTLALFLMM